MRFSKAILHLKSGEDVFDCLQVVEIENAAPMRVPSCLC